MKKRIAYALSLSLCFCGIMGGVALPSFNVLAAEEAEDDSSDASEEADEAFEDESDSAESQEEDTEESEEAEDSAEETEDSAEETEDTLEEETEDDAGEEDSSADSSDSIESSSEADTTNASTVSSSKTQNQLSADTSTSTSETDEKSFISRWKAGGTIILDKNYTISTSDLVQTKNIDLELNGCTLNLVKHCIKVPKNLNLNITDDDGLGSITGTNKSETTKSGTITTTKTYGLIEVEGGTLQSSGANIGFDGNSSTTVDTLAIRVSSGGSFTLASGTVSASRTIPSTKTGVVQEAIEIDSGNVHINGGKIVATSGVCIALSSGTLDINDGYIWPFADKSIPGVGIAQRGGTVNMYGGEIAYGALSGLTTKTKTSGVVMTTGGTFNLYKGTIKDHHCGFMIDANSTSKLNMSGGYIQDNINRGLSIAGGTVEMSAGKIQNNYTESGDYGAGIYMTGGSLKLSDTATISDNGYYKEVSSSGSSTTKVQTACGGGLYMEGGSVEMTGGRIEDNMSSSDGAGVYMRSGTFTMSEGRISNNISTKSGGAGGVYFGGGTFLISKTPVITSNGYKASGSTSATKCNFYIPDSGTISISSTDKLESGASIGVSVTKTLTFTSGYGDLNGTTTGFFSSDSTNYTLSQNSTSKEWVLTKKASSGGSSGSSSSSSSSSTSTKKSSSGGGGSSSSSNSFSKGDYWTGGKKAKRADYYKTGSTTVWYDQPTKSTGKAKTLVVPATVRLKSKTYTVTGISNEAFSGYKKLNKLTIGTNVKKIGQRAFKNCKKLNSITIKSTKLTKAKIKNCLKGSYVKTVYVPSTKVSEYQKIFTKANTKSRYKVLVLAIQ